MIHGQVQRLNTPVHHLVFATFYRGDLLRSAVADHREILEAILQRDPAAAEAAMRRHVENGLNYLRQLDNAVHTGDGPY